MQLKIVLYLLLCGQHTILSLSYLFNTTNSGNNLSQGFTCKLPIFLECHLVAMPVLYCHLLDSSLAIVPSLAATLS